MDWYKHDTDATQDAKIRKLLMHSEKTAGSGAIGYAVYFHCLELIAGNVSASNVTFELEHDSEIIADTLRIRGNSEKSGREIVESIMRYIVDLGLFDCSGDRIYCTKLLKRLDTSMTSNKAMRKMISQAKEYHDGSDKHRHDAVMIPSGWGHERIEENRIEENRTEKREEGKSARKSDSQYKTKDGDTLPINTTRYARLKDEYGESTVNDYIERAHRYSLKKKGDASYYRDYSSAAEDYMKRDGVAKQTKTVFEPEVEAFFNSENYRRQAKVGEFDPRRQ